MSLRKCSCFGINHCYICNPVPTRDKQTIIQCTGCGITCDINKIANWDIGSLCQCDKGCLNEILVEDKYPSCYFTQKNCIKCQTIQDMIDYLMLQKENCDHA